MHIIDIAEGTAALPRAARIQAIAALHTGMSADPEGEEHSNYDNQADSMVRQARSKAFYPFDSDGSHDHSRANKLRIYYNFC